MVKNAEVDSQKKRKNNIISSLRAFDLRYIILELLLLLLCWTFPYSGDDWAWGSRIGMERLSQWFANYNGRYLGNIIVLILTRSRLIRTICVSITIVLIVYCIERIISRKWAFEISLLCLTFMSYFVLRQSIVWTSGYSNYAISILLTLVYILYLNDHWEMPEKSNGLTLAMLFLLGLSNTLIVEHLTLFNVFASLVLFGVWLIRYHRFRADYLLYALGCVIGTCYMFANSAYRTITGKGDEYRTIAENGIILKAINNYFGVIYREILFNNYILNVLFFIVLFLVFMKTRKESPKSIVRIRAACLALMAFYALYSSWICWTEGINYFPYVYSWKVYFNGIATALYAIALFTSSVIDHHYERMINRRILLFWIALIIMAGPLFAVTPIGSRCFFCTYVILIIIFCEIIKSNFSDSADKVFFQKIQILSLIACLAGFAYLFKMYGRNYQYDQARLSHIRQEVKAGKKKTRLYHLPYEWYLWCATPIEENDVWEERYKLFYHIPENVDLIITEYKPLP